MSGFEAWAASFQGTMAVAACALVAGMILGWLAGTRPRGLSRRERRALADRAAARAASGFRAMRDPEAQQRREAMARRTHPVYRQPPEVAHEWEPAHVGAALAVANGDLQIYPPGDPRHDWDPSCRQRDCPIHGNWDQPDPNGDPITTGEIRAITERMDVFMARLLGEHPVPYPDGSGQ